MPGEPTEELTDADIDARGSAHRRRLWRTHGTVVLVVAAGGAFGASARYGLAQWLPARHGHVPWATFLTNVTGCFLIGVLMVAVTEIWVVHPLVRLFLGVGVLGGFTTFSTYVSEIRDLLRPDTIAVAVGYLAGTLICALLATLAAMWITRAGYERLHHAREESA
ncbi:fluoride efflux transporter CrcB [Nocardia sp. NBC_00881]|uniref:fluoride efflux transporter CrcB n=1 Tax=Nocardia sp. NBC_00881 TaxID=2975995 RepID=UPI003863A135|nr:fluoride efflux transporter CrcB [Nocardia sp. NBC_00881]